MFPVYAPAESNDFQSRQDFSFCNILNANMLMLIKR